MEVVAYHLPDLEGFFVNPLMTEQEAAQMTQAGSVSIFFLIRVEMKDV